MKRYLSHSFCTEISMHHAHGIFRSANPNPFDLFGQTIGPVCELRYKLQTLNWEPRLVLEPMNNTVYASISIFRVTNDSFRKAIETTLKQKQEVFYIFVVDGCEYNSDPFDLFDYTMGPVCKLRRRLLLQHFTITTQTHSSL